MESCNMQTDDREKTKIFLKIMKTVAFDVNPTDTIQDIKAKLCATEGSDTNQHELFFAGDHLGDATKTLANYRIPANSTLNVYVRDGMQIAVKIPSGKRITLKVDSWDTIARLKSMIEKELGIASEQQSLYHLGCFLEDHQILKACKINGGSVLQMVLRPTEKDDLRIFVSMACEKNISLEVKTWFTVMDVKIMLESVKCFPAHLQNFVYAGKSLENGLTLSVCNITDKSVLRCEIQMQIFIKTWNGNTLALTVCDTDTVAEVTEKLLEKTGSAYKKKNHYFEYAGRVLVEEKTLGKYGIVNESNIHLKPRLSAFTSER